MKTITQYLGKVSITCNGLWDVNREYDRLCLVHDGYFASYISRKIVPAGTALTNTEYWQPVANLRDDVRTHTEEFETKVIELISQIQIKLKSARIVVSNIEERDTLTINDVAPGCEVYVLETGQSWILDSIVCSSDENNNYKEWHLEVDSRIDSEEKYELEGTFDTLTADRAICDAYGNIIHDTYITRETVHNYVDSVIEDFISNWKYEIQDGTITYDMLSDALKEFIGSGGNVTNFPDEEDITVIDSQLKLKDREYKAEEFTGKGYKILRKNWMNNVNLLEQSMINEENTVYEIRYLFCLDGKSVTIPKGSILWFKGGQINNGTVVCDETLIFGVNKFEDAGTATYDGTFSIGQIMYIDDHLCWWNGVAWIDFAVGSELHTIKVIDNLESTDTDNALSANQGRVLKELIDGINLSNYVTNDTLNDTLNDYVTTDTLDDYVTEEKFTEELNKKQDAYENGIEVGDLSDDLQSRLASIENIQLQYGIDGTPADLIETLPSGDFLMTYAEAIGTSDFYSTYVPLKKINGESILGEGEITIDAGDKLPDDGTVGQVLTKTEDGYEWSNVDTGDTLPDDGTVGQVLTKTEDGVAWEDIETTSASVSVDWDDIQDKPSTFTPSAHTHTISDITDFPQNLVTDVTVSGSGNVVTDAAFSDGTLTITKGTISTESGTISGVTSVNVTGSGNVLVDADYDGSTLTITKGTLSTSGGDGNNYVEDFSVDFEPQTNYVKFDGTIDINGLSSVEATANIPAATTSDAGVMTASDKSNLDYLWNTLGQELEYDNLAMDVFSSGNTLYSRMYNTNDSTTVIGNNQGVTLKTINGTSLIGSGDITISSSEGSSDGITQETADGRYLLKSGDTCTGNLIIDGQVAIGRSTFNEKLAVEGAIVVGTSGTTSIYMAGGFQHNPISSSTVNFQMTQDGYLTCVGNIVSSGGNVSAAGSLSAGTTLNVTGNSTLGGTLSVSGNTTCGSALTVSGTSNLNNNLNVNGTSTLTGALIVTGTSNLNSSLTVGGTSTFRSNATFNSDVQIDDNLTVDGTITAGGNITAAAFYEDSDVSLKENIKPISDDAIIAADSLELKQFNFKKDETYATKYGVIAQDVEAVGLANLVRETEDGTKAVDYISLLILKIEALEKRIAELERR